MAGGAGHASAPRSCPDRAWPGAPPARPPPFPYPGPWLLGRIGPAGRGRTDAAEGPGVTWGVAGGWAAFRAGGGASGRGRRGRPQRQAGRGRSAEAPTGGRAGRGVQTRRRRQRHQRLPQDLPRAGPRWRRSLHRVSCHPRNGPDHKRRGVGRCARSGGARKKVAEAGLLATPLPHAAPADWLRRHRGPPHWPSCL